MVHKKQKSRSLSSRKRAKDMSAAMPDQDHNRYNRHLGADPPRKNSDTKLPRKAQLIAQMMQGMQQPAGAKTKRPWHREDLPRAPKPKKAARSDDPAEHAEHAPPSWQPSAAEHASEPTKKRWRADSGPSAPAARAAQKPAAKAKEVDWQRTKMPKFGETNGRPPELFQFKRK